jgi:hypothetical protein
MARSMASPNGEMPGQTDGQRVGVTGLEAADSGLVPTPLVAVTVNVYGAPTVRPPILTDVAVADTATDPTQVPFWNAHTVWPVTGEPPLSPSFHITVAERQPAAAATSVGAPGTVAIETGADGVTDTVDEYAPVPTGFTAATGKSYAEGDPPSAQHDPGLSGSAPGLFPVQQSVAAGASANR